MRVGLLTISDRSARGEREDRSGPALSTDLQSSGWEVTQAAVVADEAGLISQWLQPATIVDTSEAVLRDETFLFTNIREKAVSAAKISKTCDDLAYNLDEFKNFADRFAASRGSKLTFSYTISACSLAPLSTTISFDINLKSVSGEAASSFNLLWP